MKKLMHHSALAAAALVLSALTTSASAQDIYWDDYEGGLVDSKRSLVWAYDPAYIAGENYDGQLNLAPTDYNEARSIAENYPDFVAYWWSPFSSYAAVTAYWSNQGYGWRLPTLDEAQGFARDYGDSWVWLGLNEYYPISRYWRWTGTAANGSKKRLKEYAVYSDGSAGSFAADSRYDFWPLVVRPLEPQP